MTTLRVLGVHGIGDHHTDLSWQAHWVKWIRKGVSTWNEKLDVQVKFYLHDAIFADYPITFSGSVEALAKLLTSGAEDLFRRRRGLLDGFQNRLRWYAGMLVQWVENERLRELLRAGLVSRIKEFDPHVVCGHSLGSLVCYDTFTHPQTKKVVSNKTFVSLGSQIANPFVAGNFLAGRITTIPAAQWYHLFNEHDNVFTAPIRISDPRFKQVDTPFDIEGWADHDAAHYLGHPATIAQMWSEIAASPTMKRFIASGRRALETKRAKARLPVRRALLVGINEYPKPADRLDGCVNDAFLFSSVLQECGFAAEDIRLVLDARATARGILSRLEWLLDGAVAGDELVFYYSGHGAQLPTYGASDIVDRMDETLVPVDFDWSPERSITDDQIYDLYSQLPYDMEFLMLMDCCHSGGILRGTGPKVRGLDPPDDVRHRMLRWDAAHQMWTDRSFRPFNKDLAPTEAEQERFAGQSGVTRRLGRSLELRPLPRRKYDAVREDRGHYGPYLPIVIQACREEEYSYEYRHGVVSHGAFTFAVAKKLRMAAFARKVPTFQELIRATAKELAELGYAQHPSIVGPAFKLGRPVPWHAPARRPRRRNPAAAK
jgi:metacaspase-1